MPSLATHLHRARRGTVGLTLGGLTALAEMVLVVLLTPVHAIPTARPRIEAFGSGLVDLNRRRLVAYLDFDDLLCVQPTWPRTQSYLVRRFIVGLIGASILGLILIGVVSAAIMGWQVVDGKPVGGGEEGNTWYEIIAIAGMGLVLVFGAVWGLIGVATLERSLANQYLGPTEEELLRRRVSQLATTRAGVVEAINDERRRIERDLHDGVQQRLVALGLLLGRARRASDQEHADDLLRQAHEESQQALRDLRDVTWRVYPTALDEGGLHTALEGVAERSSVPVSLRYGLAGRLDLATETVAYFVASEAVTNALKHGGPSAIEIDVVAEGEGIVVSVRDNGSGGADPAGSGLSGLASRVAAADGMFTVDSPAGGPTVVRAWLPV
ncbi:sensor histidine kinase [Actinophytocola sp. NPDC049390]|uniref:sensor histidine kinase n=1 Tax=Actinophytocola sp. NPDC049390 TaxID=3363894 RepID=UPI0037A248F6